MSETTSVEEVPGKVNDVLIMSTNPIFQYFRERKVEKGVFDLFLVGENLWVFVAKNLNNC